MTLTSNDSSVTVTQLWTSNDSYGTVTQLWTIEFLDGLNMLPLQSRDCNFLRTKLHYEQLYIFMVPTVLFLASNDRVSESWFLPCFRVISRPHWTEVKNRGWAVVALRVMEQWCSGVFRNSFFHHTAVPRDLIGSNRHIRKLSAPFFIFGVPPTLAKEAQKGPKIT